MAEVDLSALAWRKSSASFESDCVEVAAGEGLVMVRDTRDIANVILAFSCRDWDTFLRRVRGSQRMKDVTIAISVMVPPAKIALNSNAAGMVK